MFSSKSIALLFSTLLSICAYAQPGLLDPTFADGGKLIYDFSGLNDDAKDVIVQPDGKIIVVGNTSADFVNKFAILRLNEDGSPDESFGTNGRVETQFETSNLSFAQCIALQTDGKIVVAGSSFIGNYYIMAVARYMPTGELDNTFSNDGMLTYSPAGSLSINDIAIQNDGSILLAGNTGYTGAGTFLSVIKLNSNGTIDESFGNGTGMQVVELGLQSNALGMALQSDGKIVAAGLVVESDYTNTLIVRFTANGQLDTSFDGDGIRTISMDQYDDYATQVAITSAGKILVAGIKNIDFAILRFNSNGSYDTGFSGDGQLFIDMEDSFDELHDIAIDADGKIIAAGYSGYNLYNISVLRYNANGTPDNLFSLDGKTNIDMQGTYDYGFGLALQDDGKIVVAGSTDSDGNNDFAVVRLQGVCPVIEYTQNISIESGTSFTVGNNTYTTEGTYEDTFTTPSGCDSLVITILDVFTGIENIADNGFQMWPMPFEDVLNIDNCQPNDLITITDAMGRVVYNTNVTQSYITLDLSTIPAGNYLFTIQNQDQRRTRSIVKSK